MSEQMKPCPGCGGTDLSIDGHDKGELGTGVYAVVCNHCNWRGPQSYRIEDVANRWNRRAPIAEGMVLVPKEITIEMQKAYFDVIDKNMPRVQTDARFGRFDSNREAYRAMLAASTKEG